MMQLPICDCRSPIADYETLRINRQSQIGNEIGVEE
jgi:hypothetical protein